MQYRQSLRRRITLSFVLFGALLSIIIATGVHFAIEDIEAELIEHGLKQELKHFLRQANKQLGTARQISADITLYYLDKRQDQNPTADIIRHVPAGHGEFEYENQLYYSLAKHLGNGTVYLIRDATAFEKREVAIRIALITSVVVATLVALWLGNWLSVRVISPVSVLAQQVSGMEPEKGHRHPIASQYADDEVGRLAASFDGYLRRMGQFIQREQEFTADASHELRTPLSIINNATELLLDNPDLSQRALKQVERIARAGERMQNMLEILLLLARETPTEQSERSESCSAQEAVEEIIEQHRIFTKDKPLMLRRDLIEDFKINTSRAILTIVLSNLIRNAISYTGEGKVIVRISNRCIEVKDTGEGIAPESLEHIFDRHYRGPSSKGSGIGLSIVKRICDRQGWRIEIRSEPQRGTSVSVRF